MYISPVLGHYSGDKVPSYDEKSEVKNLTTQSFVASTSYSTDRGGGGGVYLLDH
jgi:hypothetical protein